MGWDLLKNKQTVKETNKQRQNARGKTWRKKQQHVKTFMTRIE